MTYEEAVQYIHSVYWKGSRMGLGRTRDLLARLGNPQEKLKFIHIAGTNGKGSTAAMLASILKCAGYRTGLYTSPYIHRFNERMQVDGIPIPDDELAALVGEVRPHAEAMPQRPTEFELITALAFLFFARRGCEIVVLEVGMGGRLDSTNVIDTPEMAVITAIGLDHTEYLGETLAEIAGEKAGILKEGGIAVSYGGEPEADAVIRRAAEERHVELISPDFSQLTVLESDLTGQKFRYWGETWEIPFLGEYQVRNAAVVLETVYALRQKRGWWILREQIREGLLATRWRGRLEILNLHPLVLVDGSHNPQGVRATARSLRQYFPKGDIVFLIGVSSDKDVPHMGEALVPLAREFITTCSQNFKAMSSEELAGKLREQTSLPVTAAASVEEACRLALARAGESGRVCAIGSLYLVGEVTQEFERLLDRANKKSL